MIIVYNVETIKTETDRFRVSWDARPSSFIPPESVDDYNFNLLWSFDPIDEFKFVTDSTGANIVIDGAVGPFYHIHYLDHTPHDRKHYYKIRAVEKVDATNYKDFEVTYVGNRSDGILKTINYFESVLNGQYIGQGAYLVKRKTSGGRCPDCWNQLQFRRTKSKCDTCRGTGFIEGYFKAIPIQIAVDESPKISEVPLTGEIQVKTMRARMTNWPLVNPRDVLVTCDDFTRYRVTKVDITKLPNVAVNRSVFSGSNYILSQIITISELIPQDPAYGIVVTGRDLQGRGTIATVASGITGSGPFNPGQIYGGGTLIPADAVFDSITNKWLIGDGIIISSFPEFDSIAGTGSGIGATHPWLPFP